MSVCLFVCLFVCSLCVWRPYEQMQPNFPETIFTSRGRSTSTFFPKKINPPLATGAPMQLTNRITVFQNIKVLVAKAAEGRLSAHLP